ncbi:T9SS type A sorting domain-containing protein [bacterium]|nr:T9SS type A sorting domain-containing protein [bacterium]
MVLVAALLIIFNLNTAQVENTNQLTQESTQSQNNPDAPAAQLQQAPEQHTSTSSVTDDDSLKTKKDTSSNSTGMSPDMQRTTDEMSLAMKRALERRKAEHPNSPENKARRKLRNDLYAKWTKLRIQGYSIYELDPAELQNIGITLTEDGGVLEEFYDGMSTEMEEKSNGVVSYTLSFDRKDADEEKQEKKKDLYAPVLVTNSRGRTYSTTSSASGAAEQNIHGAKASFMRTLIPIKVPTENPAVATESGDYYYIYWFKPDPGFIEKLPHRVQRAVEEQQRQLEENTENGVTAPRSLAANIYPNPITQAKATVEFTLPEPRRVAVSMYDVKGERVREMSVTDQRGEGTWQEQIDIGDLSNGLYLLAVTTDGGEQSVQPIMVKR